MLRKVLLAHPDCALSTLSIVRKHCRDTIVAYMPMTYTRLDVFPDVREVDYELDVIKSKLLKVRAMIASASSIAEVYDLARQVLDLVLLSLHNASRSFIIVDSVLTLFIDDIMRSFTTVLVVPRRRLLRREGRDTLANMFFRRLLGSEGFEKILKVSPILWRGVKEAQSLGQSNISELIIVREDYLLNILQDSTK